MLGTVATTAAGVVAGSFPFQGIGNLTGQHNNQNALGAANIPSPAAQNSVVNNYCDATGPDQANEIADSGDDTSSDELA